jgi:type IV fimbrial biogenesis protein FimT
MTRPPPPASGFTIIELMITIAVASVLLGLAVPAFTDMVRNTRIANQANAIVGALNYARAETTVRGMPISICAANNAGGNTCVAAATNATSWQNGWVIFTDRSGVAGVLDATDQLLQTGAAPATGFSVVNTASFVRFGVGATPSTAGTFTVAPTMSGYCASTGNRQIAVGLTGRVNTSKSPCS